MTVFLSWTQRDVRVDNVQALNNSPAASGAVLSPSHPWCKVEQWGLLAGVPPLSKSNSWPFTNLRFNPAGLRHPVHIRMSNSPILSADQRVLSALLPTWTLRLSVPGHPAAVCAPSPGASLIDRGSCAFGKREPSDSGPKKNDHCRRDVQKSTKPSPPAPQLFGTTFRQETRASPLQSLTKEQRVSKLGGGDKTSGATISHSSAPQLSSAAVRRASSRSSSAGMTSPAIHRGGTRLPGSASPPASTARKVANLDPFRSSSTFYFL